MRAYIVLFYRNIARGFSYVIICLCVSSVIAGEKMKKAVLASTMALLVVSLITQVMASTATVFEVVGSYTGSATVPGEVWVTEDGILHVKGGEGFGPVSGDLPGEMWFSLSGAIDLNTGFGSMHGKWVFTDDHGTFEGSYRAENYGVVYYDDGSAGGKGTGGYEGMVYRVDPFWGYNLYLGGYTGEDGVYFEFVGRILSPHGEPLPT